MQIKNTNSKILFIISAVLLIAVMATFFVISKQKADDKRIKGVFVIDERGGTFGTQVYKKEISG